MVGNGKKEIIELLGTFEDVANKKGKWIPIFDQLKGVGEKLAVYAGRLSVGATNASELRKEKLKRGIPVN